MSFLSSLCKFRCLLHVFSDDSFVAGQSVGRHAPRTTTKTRALAHCTSTSHLLLLLVHIRLVPLLKPCAVHRRLAIQVRARPLHLDLHLGNQSTRLLHCEQVRRNARTLIGRLFRSLRTRAIGILTGKAKVTPTTIGNKSATIKDITRTRRGTLQ